MKLSEQHSANYKQEFDLFDTFFKQIDLIPV